MKLFKLKGAFGGLLLGFGIAGLGMALIYIVPVYIQPYLSEEATYETENFILHYHKDSQVAEEVTGYAETLEEDLAKITSYLKIGLEVIPEKVNAFLLDHPGQIKGAIMARKNPKSLEIYLAVIDVVRGENPCPQLVELVTTFAWGMPSSRILTRGLELYLCEPTKEWYAEAAALLGKSFFTLQELLRLEETGRFPPSLYESFNSPKAPMAMSLATLSVLLRVGTDPFRYPPIETLRTLSASLVKFLLDLQGVERFKLLWEYYNFEEGVWKFYNFSIEELNHRWQLTLKEKGLSSPSYPYLRGKSLTKLGKYNEALSYLKLIEDPKASEIKATIYFNLGQKEKLILPTASKIQEKYKEWKIYQTANLVIHYPPDTSADIEAVALSAEKIFIGVMERLGLSRNELPDKIIIFLYNTQEQAREILGELVELPWSDYLGGVLHLRYDQPLGFELALTMSRHMQRGVTYSRLLRWGLGWWLSGDKWCQKTKELIKSEDWIPLEFLDFDVYPRSKVRPVAACMVGYLLERYGVEKLKELWSKTSIIGEYMSLDRGMMEIYGFSRRELEKKLEEFLGL
jgi:hypothetical protein